MSRNFDYNFALNTLLCNKYKLTHKAVLFHEEICVKKCVYFIINQNAIQTR